MPNSDENEATEGWVRGEMPENGGRKTTDEGRQTFEAAVDSDAVEAEAQADETGVPDEVALPIAEPEVPAEPAASPVEPDEAARVELVAAVQPIFLGEAVLPLEEGEPEAVAAAIEAELQTGAIVTEAEAEAGAALPVIDQGQTVPVTSEAELAGAPVVEPAAGAETEPEPGVGPAAEAAVAVETAQAPAGEPAAEVGRPEEQAPEEAVSAPGAAAEAPAPEKPKRRGKKARDPQPTPTAAEAVDGLSLASQPGAGEAVTIGPLPVNGDLSLVAQVESLLFVADGAVPVARLAEALEIPPREVEAALLELAESYQKRGLSLQRFRDRVQLTTAPAAAVLVERFLGLAASTPLSRAALEALAIVAYQQPVTRPQIEAVRGVNSDSVIKNLLTKGLIEESGRAEGPGRPVLYSTTSEFMQHFGLASLNDLPPLTPPTADPDAEAKSAEYILKG